MKKHFKKTLSVFLALTLTIPSISFNFADNNQVKAAELGSLANKVTGTWSYWDGEKDVVQSNESLMDKLPSIANKGVTRWTTDNYDKNNGAFDMGEWGTSLMWKYSYSDNWGGSTYAIPMSYKATPNGFYVVKPSTVKIEQALLMEQPENGTLTDFVVGPTFTAGCKKVDKVTDWTYDVVFEDASNPAINVKSTIAQGSPFSYYQANGTNQMKVTRLRDSLPSYISYYNGSSIANSTMIVLRVFDNQDDSVSYSNHDYYAVFVPEGTKWTQTGASGVNGIGTLTATFPSSDKAYMSFAWLCEETGSNMPGQAIPAMDNKAKTIAEEYYKYAYNFITGTKASYTYDSETSVLKTKYEYTLDKKSDSKTDGTVMGILPHQYKNMSGYQYLNNTARTIRGTMKFIAGSSYETKLTYTGILPGMMSIDTSNHAKLQEYVTNFMNEYGPTATAVTKEGYSVNTYDSGKKLNRAVQVMLAAEECGDTASATALLNGIKAELADWFTASGEGDEKYFYYNSDIGTLFGFPQAYYTVDGVTDHHFHYGYFINAAAQVIMRDPTFAAQYGNIVEELIGDIATTEENNPDARYPQLRYFSQYEGHSWASGHANFADGNNQESSSEAINAWAGLILYGQATGNKKLTETGIYLYTTEVSAINNYWLDIDNDVLDKTFKKTNGSLPKYIQASMVWGGKYGYETWWTAEPLQTQGINILPVTAASFYLANNKQYVLDNLQTALNNEAAYNGQDKDNNRWNEIWSAYVAMADPVKAMNYFNDRCSPEAGDSKAHTFHTIKAFAEHGTPDLTVTGNTPLSHVFKDADGNMTYVAYNAGTEDITVKYTDGTSIVAKAGEMTIVSEKDMSDRAAYKVEHYLEQSDGSYTLKETENKAGKIGNEVTARSKNYDGYVLDEENTNTKANGSITADGNLVLKLYYKINKSSGQPGTDSNKPSVDDNRSYTSLGEYNGKSLSYCIEKDDFNVAIKLLDANETFYIEYSGEFNENNTKGYMNGTETSSNVYTGVYKFATRILEADTYTTIKLVCDNGKEVVIIVKYGNPTSGPVTEETTTKKPEVPETTTKKPETPETTTKKPETPETTTKKPETPETTTKKPETPETTTKKPEVPETTTKKPEVPETTTKKPSVNPTVKETTTKIKVGKTKVTKASKLSKKKVKLTLKKVKKAKGYQLSFYTSKTNAKKNKKVLYKRTVTKSTVKISSSKFKNKKKLYVKARAFVYNKNGKKVYGDWSNVKRVKVK